MADRNAIIERLARMFCEADEFNPDDRIRTTDINDNPTTYPRWNEYLVPARKAYEIAHGR